MRHRAKLATASRVVSLQLIRKVFNSFVFLGRRRAISAKLGREMRWRKMTSVFAFWKMCRSRSQSFARGRRVHVLAVLRRHWLRWKITREAHRAARKESLKAVSNFLIPKIQGVIDVQTIVWAFCGWREHVAALARVTMMGLAATRQKQQPRRSLRKYLRLWFRWRNLHGDEWQSFVICWASSPLTLRPQERGGNFWPTAKGRVVATRG